MGVLLVVPLVVQVLLQRMESTLHRTARRHKQRSFQLSAHHTLLVGEQSTWRLSYIGLPG